MPKAVSLFSGCGGADLGLRQAGFEIVMANDVWDGACRLYRKNVPDVEVVCGDIAGIERFPAADLLVGCYPCQGFSQAGARNPSSKINYLYRQFDRALRLIRPKAFIVENVRGMAFGRNRVLLQNQLVRFRLAGYSVKWDVLDAKDFGLAQNRKRLFIVGIRSDLGIRYAFPDPQYGDGRAFAYRTQLDELAGMDLWPEGQFCPEKFHWYYMSRRRRYDWDEPSPCIVGHWRHVPLHPLSPKLKRISTDEWRFSHEGPARRLSLAECAKLQGFQEAYDWSETSVKDAFWAAGNAVPPPVLEAIADSLPDVW